MGFVHGFGPWAAAPATAGAVAGIGRSSTWPRRSSGGPRGGEEAMASDSWTAERIDLLRTLWAEGETASAIAVRLGGMSRSAVLGKIFRLRLGADDAAATSAAKKNAAANHKSKRAGPRTQRAGRAPPAPGIPAPSAPNSLLARRRGGKRDKPSRWPPAASSAHKTLLELTNDSCRWPHGRPGTEKFFFCGAAGADLEHGIPYCARHMRRAYPAPENIVEEAKLAASRGVRSFSSSAPTRGFRSQPVAGRVGERAPQAHALNGWRRRL